MARRVGIGPCSGLGVSLAAQLGDLGAQRLRVGHRSCGRLQLEAQRLGFGLEVAFVDVPVPGMTTYVDPVISFIPIAQDGNGVWTFPMAGLLVGAAGLTFTHQGVVIDPGEPIGFSVTNGLSLTYGL